MKTASNFMDLKDRRILYELDKNARISYAQLGRKIGLSTEVVHYRVNKLQEEGILKQFQTVVNYSKLGLIHFKICLSFNGISLKNEEEIYSEINTISQVVWIAKCQGDWDCMISCTVNNLEELDRIKDKIIAISNQYISKKSISVSSNIWSFPRKYLIKEKYKEYYKTNNKESRIDDVDLKLLRVLSKDARKPIIDISQELGLNVKTITSRIKKLLKSGIINNFRLVVDYEKMGIHFYKTMFYLKNPDEIRTQELLNYLNNNSNLVHNLKVIGDWDLEPEFEFENTEDFYKTIQDLMNQFSDVIRKVSVINILKEYKYTYFYK